MAFPTGLLTGPLFKYLSIALTVVIAGMAIYLSILKEDIEDLTEWQDRIVVAVQGATGDEEADANTAARHILALGRSVENLRRGIDTQNRAVAEMASQRDEAKRVAELERERRRAAVDNARSRAVQLDRAAETPVPEEEVMDSIRRAQDEAYLGGM